MADQVIIYTDGACRGNPGPGGWGVVIQCNNETRHLFGGEAATTNNRMELMSAIQALEQLKQPSRIKLHTDSKYVLRGFTEWLPNWKKNRWMTSARKPVKNDDLWRRLDTAITRHQVSWIWVKGHNGNPGNEAADRLANQGVDQYGVMAYKENNMNSKN